MVRDLCITLDPATGPSAIKACAFTQLMACMLFHLCLVSQEIRMRAVKVPPQLSTCMVWWNLT